MLPKQLQFSSILHMHYDTVFNYTITHCLT